MTQLAAQRTAAAKGLALVVAATLLAAIALLINTASVASAADISSAGPLTLVTTTTDLNCAVNHVDDTDPEFFGTTACGTFVTDGTNLYGPASVPAGSNATGVTGYVAWTPVSQVGPTGTGTPADPYTIVTTVTGGPFTVVQTDTYILGQESYATSVHVTSSAAVNAIIYRAGDCYLQNSDYGLGELGPGNAPTCKALSGSTDPNRIQQWYPLTAGSNHMVGNYDSVWAAIGSMQPFADTVFTTQTDNGAGLSWSKSLAAGASTTVSHLTVFSPGGILPVTVTKSVTPSTVATGGTVAYTITLNNASGTSIPISSITDHLPNGFTYVAGSTSGATTADPTVSGQDLTWAGSYSVPAGTPASPGTLSLTFSATAPDVPGTYTNSASAVGSQGATVIPATDVAAVIVTTGTTPTTVTPTSVTPTTTPTTVTPTSVTPTTASPTTAAPTTAAPSTVTPTTAAPVKPTTTVTVDVNPTTTARPAAPVAVTPTYTG